MGRYRPIRPSAAIRAKYEARLSKEVADMGASLAYWLRAQYRKTPPAIAIDSAIDAAFTRAFKKLSKQWLSRFDTLSEELGAYFATAVGERVDGALARMLRDGGMTVRFTASQGQRDALGAVLADNVALIKSVGSEHLADVEGIVRRAVMTGRDLGTMTREIKAATGATQRRAAGIAKHQNRMATSVLERARQTELGVTEARWRHSSAGKVPRPSHVAFSGKTYNLAKGAYLDGVWTWPGIEINCRCTSEPIIAGFND